MPKMFRKAMVEQKKGWALGLLTLTESSIAKAQNDNSPELSAESKEQQQ